jgi:hypothetical protein
MTIDFISWGKNIFYSGQKDIFLDLYDHVTSFMELIWILFT